MIKTVRRAVVPSQEIGFGRLEASVEQPLCRVLTTLVNLRSSPWVFDLSTGGLWGCPRTSLYPGEETQSCLEGAADSQGLIKRPQVLSNQNFRTGPLTPQVGSSVMLQTAFSDSVVYFTEIMPVEGAKLDAKTKFLLHRQYYAYELKDYMNFQENMPGRTSVIYFSEKRSKLEKQAAKIKKRLVEKDGKTVRYLGDKFKFVKP